MGFSVGTLYATIQVITTQFQQGLNTAGAQLQAFGMKMTALGRSITLLTAPLAAFAAGAVKTGIDFDTSMAKIQGLVGVTADELGRLRQAALDLAGETGRSPLELADALYYLTSSGLSADQSISTLEVSAKAAAAGLGETKDVARAVAFALNAYGDEGVTAVNVTDMLIAGVKDGTIEADEFADVLGRIIGVASSVDVSFNQIVATLAVLSRVGLDSHEAMTSVSSIFSNLLKPGAASKDIIDSLGMSMEQLRDIASSEPNGLVQVYRILNDRLSDEQFSRVVPNVRALRGALNLLSQDTASVDEVFRNAYASAGNTDKAFGVFSQTVQFKLDRAVANLQVTMLALWDVLRGPIATVLDMVSAGLKALGEWFISLPPDMQNLIAVIGGLAIAIGPLLIVLGLLAIALGGLGFLFSPIVAIIAVVGAIAVGAVILADKLGILDDILGILSFAFDAIVKVLGIAWDFIMKVVDAALKLANAFFAMVRPALDAVVKLLGMIWQAIKPVVEFVLKLVGAFADIAGSVIGKILNDIANAFRLVGAAIDFVLSIGSKLGDFFHDLWMKLNPGQEAMDAAIAKLHQFAAAHGWSEQQIATAWEKIIQASHEGRVNTVEELDALMAKIDDDMKHGTVSLGGFSKEIQRFTRDGAVAGDTVGGLGEKIAALDFEKAKQDASDLDVLFRALPYTFKQTDESYAEFARQTNKTVDEVKAAWMDFKLHLSEALTIVQELPDGFEMTQSAAEALARGTEVSAEDILAAWQLVKDGISGLDQQMEQSLGSISEDAVKAWRAFEEAPRFSMDQVEERITELQAHLDELNNVDMASLGPTARLAWQKVVDATSAEMAALVGYVDSGGKEIGKLVDNIADDVQVMADDIVSALKGLAVESNKSWKDFMDSLKPKKNQKSPEEMIAKLQGRIEDLKAIFPTLPATSLAAWTEMMTGTQEQLLMYEGLLNHSGNLTETVIPDAINAQVDKDIRAWGKTIGMTDEQLDALLGVVTPKADDIGNAVPDALTDSQGDLDAALGDVKSSIGGVFGGVGGGKGVGGGTSGGVGDAVDAGAADIASALPDALAKEAEATKAGLALIESQTRAHYAQSLIEAQTYSQMIAQQLPNALRSQLPSVRGQLQAILAALVSSWKFTRIAAMLWGNLIGSTWVDHVASAIRAGKWRISAAVYDATSAAHGSGLPKKGPLSGPELKSSATAIATAWRDPLVDGMMKTMDALSAMRMPALAVGEAFPLNAAPALAAASRADTMRGDHVEYHDHYQIGTLVGSDRSIAELTRRQRRVDTRRSRGTRRLPGA